MMKASLPVLLLMAMFGFSGGVQAKEIICYTFNDNSNTATDYRNGMAGGQSNATLDAGSSIVIQDGRGYLQGSATAAPTDEIGTVVPSAFLKQGSLWARVKINAAVASAGLCDIEENGTTKGLENLYYSGSFYSRQPDANYTGIVQAFSLTVGHEYDIAASWIDANGAGYTYRSLFIKDVTAGTGWQTYAGYSPVHATGSNWKLQVSSLGASNYLDEFRLYDTYYGSINDAPFYDIRPAMAYLRNKTVNVQDYVTGGSGTLASPWTSVHDNGPIQSAIWDPGNSGYGVTLNCSPGYYRCKNTGLPGNWTIQGTGTLPGDTVLAMPGDNQYLFAFTCYGSQNTIHNLTMLCNQSISTGYHLGLGLFGCSEIALDQVTIEDAYNAVRVHDGVHNVKLTQCTFDGSYAAVHSFHDYDNITDFTIDGCLFTGAYAMGVSWDLAYDMDNIVIENCSFDSWDEFAVSLACSQYVKIRDNTFSESTSSTGGYQNAIHIEDRSHDVLVSGNDIRSIDGAAIDMMGNLADPATACYNIEIANNYLHDAGSLGIRVRGHCHDISIGGNIIDDADTGIIAYQNANNVSIVGNTLRYCVNDAIYFTYDNESQWNINPTIEDNVILWCGGNGLSVGRGKGDIRIYNNHCYDLGGCGIFCWGTNTSDATLKIINNSLCTCDGSGILIGAGAATALCYNNNSYYNGADGIYYNRGGQGVLQARNNIVLGNHYRGIEGAAAGDVSSNYNDVYGNWYGGYFNCSAGGNDIAADPLFSDGKHLQSGSPCVNAGVTLSDVPDDCDGESRPRGAAYDIGCDEF